MTVDDGIKVITENCGSTMFVKCGTSDVLCTIVGFGIQKNTIHADKDDLFILGYKNKHNDVDFPKDTLSMYTIMHKIDNAVEAQYVKIPFECSKIYKNKIISCFV